MFYVIEIIVSVVVFLWILFHWKIRHTIKETKNIPGIESYPLIGSAHLAFGKNNEEIFNLMKSTFSLAWNNPIKIWLGPIFFVAVSNVDDIQAITNSPNCVEKHYVYNFFESKGLFSAPSKIWKPERKILNPTFNAKILNSFLPIFMESSKLMIKNMEQEIGKESFELTDYLFAYTLETICRTAMGYNIEVLSNKNGDFVDALKEVSKLIAERIFRFWLHPNLIYQQTSKSKEEQKYKETLYKISQKIINEKKTEYLKLSDEEKNIILNQDEDYKQPQIFLNQLFKIATENDFSDEHIKDHVNTMIVAGTETTTLTLSYILLMLANHPDIQERVLKEIQENYTGSWEPTSLSQLIYMEMVIKETLRLYPIGPFIGRMTTDKVELKNHTLPAGVAILISFYHLHRDPKVWGPNAEVFNPDNFLPENMSKRNPNSFGGFSLGLRNCIGYRYAMMSMKIVIADFLMAYKINTSVKPHQFRHALDITLKLLNGFYISIERRIKINQ